MTDEAAPGSAGPAPLKTLANKVNWVLDKAHTAGRAGCPTPRWSSRSTR